MPDLLAPWREEPATAGLLTDFDGTLAPIVDDPDQARPIEGAAELLAALAEKLAVVAVLSGRPVAFLQQFLPPPVVLSGLYGLEVVRDGERRDHPAGDRWRQVIEDVVSAARAGGPAGMRVESKGLSLTLHYREYPDAAADVRVWAEHEAVRTGLLLRSARMSVELHPPVDADKGTAVHDLAEGLRAVCFIGDDVGDLPAFAALDDLAATGIATVRVGVRSEEAPPELLERADLVVDGPAGALQVLRSLQ